MTDPGSTHTWAFIAGLRTWAILLGVAAVFVSCKSPEQYRREASDVAYDAVAAAQKQAIGETEPFTIDRPADLLRKRLLLDQNLPVADEASLGATAVQPIEQWPDEAYLQPSSKPSFPDIVTVPEGEPVQLSLLEALQVAARNSRDYQTQKEQVFVAALNLDLERDDFRNTWSGVLASEAIVDRGSGDSVSGFEHEAGLGFDRLFRNGVNVSTGLALNLAQLLTGDRTSSLGLVGDATVSIPLLRGSGEFIVAEPLRQAQRNLIYEIYSFERFKREFAVEVADSYLGVLQQLDQVDNATENYRNLVASTRRAQRLAEAGRLPEVQVDQARQDELRARDRWISAEQSYLTRLDQFKQLLGLPTDARIALNRDELRRLGEAVAPMLEVNGFGDVAFDAEEDAGESITPAVVTEANPKPTAGVPADVEVELVPPDPTAGGPYEMEEPRALRLAFENRLDLRTSVGRVFDAQRKVAVAADNLRADLTLLGRASVGEGRSLGSAGQDDGDFSPRRGTYSALLQLDLPLERTRERNEYRAELIDFERSIRDLQDLEDRIKFSVRQTLRTLLQARESVRIQARAVELAQRRVDSTNLFLQAGRAEIRDLLEAQESLISAQNALTSAIVRYRVAELELQRDLGLLKVDSEGLWREFDPSEYENGTS